MKTVITVDLDYWTNYYKNTNRPAIKLLKELRKAASKSFLVWEHHEILDVIPRGTKRIINIDYHNDIVGENLDINDEINEGTWGNFLPKSVELFQWMYPSYKMCIKEGWGLCTGSDGKVSRDYPVCYTECQNWRFFDCDGLHTFVLCVSPGWAQMHGYEDYLSALNIEDDPLQDVIKI